MFKNSVCGLVLAACIAAIVFFMTGYIIEAGARNVLVAGAGVGLLAGLSFASGVSRASSNKVLSVIAFTALIAVPAVVTSGFLVKQHTERVAELRDQRNSVMVLGFVELELTLVKTGKHYMTAATLEDDIKSGSTPVPVNLLQHLRINIDVIGHKEANGDYQINFDDLKSYKSRLQKMTRNW